MKDSGTGEEENFEPWITEGGELLKGTPNRTITREWARALCLIDSSGIEKYQGGVPVLGSVRGNGKTVIVVRHAVRLLETDNWVALCEHPPFVNRLNTRPIKIGLARIQSDLADLGRWTSIWTLALVAHAVCMVLRERRAVQDSEAESSIDRELERLYNRHRINPTLRKALGGEDFRLSDYLYFVWTNSKGHYAESIGPSIAELIDSGWGSERMDQAAETIEHFMDDAPPEKIFAIHLDAIDEALRTLSGKMLFTLFSTQPRKDEKERLDESGVDRKYLRGMVENVWLNFQKGFVVACHNVNQRMPNVQIRGVVRIEALRALEGQAAELFASSSGKIKDVLYTELVYSSEEIRRIFELNVERTKKEDLACPEHPDHAVRLFGFGKVLHSRVYGEMEDIFTLFMRHTFGSARDLVAIAKAAKDAAKSSSAQNARLNNILKAIDEASVSRFDDWKESVVPFFHSELKDRLLLLRKNILTERECREFEQENGHPGFFDNLYARGMVGLPIKRMDTDEYQLLFHPPSGNEDALPKNFGYLALHPALSAWICHQHKREGQPVGEAFYEADFIVGHGLPCPPPRMVPATIVLDITRRRAEWALSNEGRELNLHQLHKNNGGDVFTEPRKRAIREIICALALATKRRRYLLPLTCERLKEEQEYLKRVGLLKTNLEEMEYAPYLKRKIYGDSKGDLIKEINNQLKQIGLAVKKSFGDQNSKESGQVVSIALVHTRGSSDHHQWHNVKPEEIRLRLNQDRIVE